MLKGLVRDPWGFFRHGLLLPLLGWLFIVPLALVVPRRKNLVILWGRDRGEFTDNVKYLYLHLFLQAEPGLEFHFLTESREVFNNLRAGKMPVLFFPGLRTAWLLLRAGVIVSDSDVWVNRFRYHLLFSAYKVQLWHGVGLKTIGLDNPRVQRMLDHFLMRAYFRLKGKLVRYDLLVSTGDAFIERGYPTGINKKKTIPAGYPRNDVFFRDFQGHEMLGVDLEALEKIKAFRSTGGRVAVYLPTFRDSGQDPITGRVVDIPGLDLFCRQNSLLLVFKFHSWGMLRDRETREQISAAANILIYDNSRDIYPALPHTDLMISDYSSVYMDYLLLDRPIVFFTYDLEDYLRNERDFYFSYDELTPGPKCRNQQELTEALAGILAGCDDYREERAGLCRRTFNHRDGRAAERIWRTVSGRNQKN